MVTAQDIRFSYDDTTVLEFPDIHCDAGETLLILGQSGVGKSTILHLLGGLMKPKSGSIRINDRSLESMRGAHLDHFRGQHIGIIFQKNHFVRSLNVIQNLELAQFLATNKTDQKKAEDLLTRLNLSHKAHSAINELSQGEQQRVSIARALINEPQLILADEPTSALDDVNCETVLNLLKSEAKKVNAALIIVTHDQRIKDSVDRKIILS